jgi:hypothetical protein
MLKYSTALGTGAHKCAPEISNIFGYAYGILKQRNISIIKNSDEIADGSK